MPDRGGRRDVDPDHSDIPLDGDVLLAAAATASVSPARLAPLLRSAQAHLASRVDAYRRSYECAFEDGQRAVFLVPDGHWRELGAEIEITAREADALQRAHGRQLRRTGTKTNRRAEWESALEIREAVVVGTKS
ncbi:hypothetical protein [Halobellus sp. GM3]|uniref:hypothetical protein n=1 Tax=Halobellus sp. GM3 TaxID=3458410 RepID=UPI00403D6C8C